MRRKIRTVPPNNNSTAQTTKAGLPYQNVRKLAEYVGSTKARYLNVALPILPRGLVA